MGRVLPAVVLSALVLAAAAAAGGSEPSPPSVAALSTGPAATAAPTARRITAVAELERQVLGAINDLRRQRGLTPLRLNEQLSTAAREHSNSMAEHGFFRHASYDGSAFWRRIKPLYPPVDGHYWGAGENLVWASPGLSATLALEMWLKSPPHRKNLLTPAWREVGIGGVHALAAPGVYKGLEVTIVTADFGTR
jgi:uncharacterized protein YkwD